MLSDLFNDFMDSNENATKFDLNMEAMNIQKINAWKAECAIKILSSIAAQNPSTDDTKIQEQVNTSIKYADVLCNTMSKLEKEQFAKARKRIK